MKVLLIVDPLNDFCPGGSLAVPDADRVMPVINRLGASGEFDLVVALKEQHPANHVSFASRYPGKKTFDQIEIHGVLQTLWPDHCVEGSPGAEFYPALQRDLIDWVVLKGTALEVDSYSGFFDNNHSGATELQALLEREAFGRFEGVSDIEITVCGLALDFCVKATALDSAKLGYHTKVMLDACRAVNLKPGDDVKAMIELSAAGVELTQSSSILSEYTFERRKRQEVRASR